MTAEPVRAYDLHTHTLFSDGRTTPGENVRLAAEAGVTGLAVTDHDTFDGWEEAAVEGQRAGVEVIPGVELSAELGGRSLHLLGYWIDPLHAELAAECLRLRGERDERARRIVTRLGDLGVGITMQRVRELAAGAPVGRPHVAAAMVEAGAVPDLQAAFDRYLGDGGPAHVVKHALAPATAVRLIVDAGGVAVVAHPGAGSRGGEVSQDLLDDMVAAGLAGVEADHPGHDPDTRERWRRIAAGRDLEVTGSSDFHGDVERGRIGVCTTPGAVVDRLRAKMKTGHANRPEEGLWPGQRSD